MTLYKRNCRTIFSYKIVTLVYLRFIRVKQNVKVNGANMRKIVNNIFLQKYCLMFIIPYKKSTKLKCSIH